MHRVGSVVVEVLHEPSGEWRRVASERVDRADGSESGEAAALAEARAAADRVLGGWSAAYPSRSYRRRDVRVDRWGSPLP